MRTVSTSSLPSWLSLALCLSLIACQGTPPETEPSAAEKPTSEASAAESIQPPARAASRPLETKSVKPGINKRFKDPNMSVARAKKMFEGESREIFAQRVKIAKTLELRPGEAVADIGSGTGLFLQYFTKDVGDKGKVYAVEISPKFIQHIEALAKQKNWTQVRAVFCTDKSTKLDQASIDAAFVCDTYHHFEYPRTTLASIHQALKPGGRLVIADFERIPGKSRKWILGHVRCGKKTVIQEVTDAGFVYVDEVKIPGLRENYLIRFKRP